MVLSFHHYSLVRENIRLRKEILTRTGFAGMVGKNARMVLEAFPSIYKVKCLQVGTSQDPRLADVIQIVVIPDIQGKLPFGHG